MIGSHPDSPPLRAVLLSRDPFLRARMGELCPAGWRSISVVTGYEAAAELLADQAAALLLDLRVMSGAHRGLIDLARQADVLMLGIAGKIPSDMSAGELDGLRRIEIGDVRAILASLKRALTSERAEPDDVDEQADEEQAPGETEPATETVPADDELDEPEQPEAGDEIETGNETEHPGEGQYVPVAAEQPQPTPAADAATDPAETPTDQDSAEPDADQDASCERAEPSQPIEYLPPPDRPAEPAEPKTPGNRLTPEEIASLLEDEQ